MTIRRRRQLQADHEAQLAYEEELLTGAVTDSLNALIHSLGLTQRELARRLGVSEGRVSQVLAGTENVTLATLASFGWALGVRFELIPTELESRNGSPAEHDPDYPEWLDALRDAALNRAGEREAAEL
jgi:transcriptional regulator with XRE-family HTH domain